MSVNKDADGLRARGAAAAAAAAGAAAGASSNASGADWVRLLGPKLVRHSGAGGALETVDTAEALAGKHVGLYFSAHWCPPCQRFTPRLADVYTRVQKDGVHAWEVVFVSHDSSQEQFEGYFAGMPWLAVPFESDALRGELARKFRVAGIPTLSMMAPDTTILAANARSAVAVDAGAARFPWAGAEEPRSFPVLWMLAAVLIFWFIQTFFLPPSQPRVPHGG